MTKFKDVHDAWDWLYWHPIFFAKRSIGLNDSNFTSVLSIDVVRVNRDSGEIEENKPNEVVEIWLEAGPIEEPSTKWEKELFPSGVPTHDIDLDCGGRTFEEAVIKLAEKVLDKYGNYEEEDSVEIEGNNDDK